jgi:ABC-type branched-subunit amino acid transport system ATPase component
VDDIAELLLRMRAARGVALVVVEQRLEFIAALADRALVMQKGRVVKEIEAGGLRDRTALEGIVGMGA